MRIEKKNALKCHLPQVSTVFLHGCIALLTSAWLIAVASILGHPILTENHLRLLVGLVFWLFVWQGPYAILRPHRPVALRLYLGSLAGWSFIWLAAAAVLHRTGTPSWLLHHVLHFPFAMPFSGLIFVATKWGTRHLVSKPETGRRRVLILGSGARASIAWRELRTRFHSAVEVVGFVDDRPLEDMAPDLSQRIVSSVENLPNHLLHHVVDEIVLAAPIRSCYDMLQGVVGVAESCGVNVTYMRDVISVSASRMDGTFDMFHDMIPAPQSHRWHSCLKRTLDIVCSAMLLLVLAPLFLVIAIAIKLTSIGPVFFLQDRVGYRRRHFPMIKFRSMVRNAPNLMAALEGNNQASGPLFKMEDDPRITSLGRFLRRTSLDELPQLINVIAGDMSLVGPRPMSLRDVDHITDVRMLRRFSVKPGMTGMWQINGRSSTSSHQWIAMDAHYIDRWSVGLDVQLILQTVPAVLKRSGAL